LEINNTLTGEIIIIGQQIFSNTVIVTDYHDINGKFIVRVESNGNTILNKTLGWSGPVGGSGWNAKGFWGNWSKCVGDVGTGMTSGSLVGSVTFLLCAVMSPECALTVAAVCAISAKINTVNLVTTPTHFFLLVLFRIIHLNHILLVQ